MVFSSLVFLSVFLPLQLLIYYLAPRSWRNYILLAGSLFFYAWGEVILIWVMIASILWNHFTAVWIDIAEDPGRKKRILTLGILANLAALGYFKYTDFFISNWNFISGMKLPLLHIVLPIGISFYTFQAISYLVDVYRKDTKAEKNPVNTGLYIAFFPQLIAGPIVKFHEIASQIRSRTESIPEFAAGMQRFLEGLAKKILIANVMGEMADTIFTSNISALTPADAWLGALAYTLQIFFDFSGYSDMAIGLGHMFGFTIPENFKYPYISTSITEFWRRWHISLSTWFKEYLYIPLGGSRKTQIVTLRNLLIVFAVTGFWHGAGWTFIIWGFWHGFFIIVERLLKLDKREFPFIAKIFLHLYLLLTVIIGWVFFRADDFSIASGILAKMFSFHKWQWISLPVSRLFIASFIAGILFSTLLPQKLYSFIREKFYTLLLWRFACCGLLFLVLLRLAKSAYNPFIYFRF